MNDLSKEEFIEIILEQRQQIASLQKQVAELTRLLGLDSQSSSRPPSTSSCSKRNKRKSKSKRKPGAQPGRNGHHRELLPPEQVDDFVTLFPDACQACLHELLTEAKPGVVLTDRYKGHDWLLDSVKRHRRHIFEPLSRLVSGSRWGQPQLLFTP